MLTEPRLVVVQAHLAVIDGRDAVLRVEHVLLVDRLERRGLVRVEEVALERAGEEVVVDPEEDVALRIARGQKRLRQGFARVARLEDRQLEPALLLEGLLYAVGDDERVVGDEHDLRRRVVTTSAGSGTGCEQADESGEDNSVAQSH